MAVVCPIVRKLWVGIPLFPLLIRSQIFFILMLPCYILTLRLPAVRCMLGRFRDADHEKGVALLLPGWDRRRPIHPVRGA